MSNLDKLIENGIMDVQIEFEGKPFKFNLGEEVKISEATLRTSLITHVSRYSFILMLYRKLIAKARDAERNMKKIKAEQFKELYEENGNASLTRETIDANNRYQMAYKKWIALERDKDIIEACVRSFETRKDLLQTLSANIRNERTNS